MEPRRILIVQLRRVGDVLLTTPVVTNLRRRFPEARIDFLVEPPGDQVLQGHPGLDEVLRYDKSRPLAWLWQVRRRRYDWVVDLQGNPRTALLTLASGAAVKAGFDFRGRGWAYGIKIPRSPVPKHIVQQKLDLLRALDVPCEAPELTLSLDRAERRQAEEFLRGQGSGPGAPLIGLVPTHRRATRRWTARGFAALADRVQAAHGAKVVLFWGPGEEDQRDAVLRLMKTRPIVIPKIGLRGMAALLERCEAVVTNCNGPMHLAEAVGVPTLTIYGPTEPVIWNPGGPRQIGRAHV